MPRDGSVSRRAFLATTAAVGAASGCLGGGPSPSEKLDEYRSDLETYADVGAALRAGYRTTAKFVRTDEGVLGEPLVDFQVESVDPTRPNGLLYAITEAGTYEPLGCKWYVPADETDDPPSLFGREFDGPFESDVPFVPEHYALHAWVFRDNPEGTFARYNPAVEVPDVVDSIATARDALSDYATGRKATDAGYRNTEKCVGGDDGSYGVAFVREERPEQLSVEKPPILLFRVTENWSYVLLGAEWYVPEEVDEPPSLFGREFEGPTAGHSPKVDQPEHYGLHAWLFRTNPEGMFARYNPSLTC